MGAFWRCVKRCDYDVCINCIIPIDIKKTVKRNDKGVEVKKGTTGLYYCGNTLDVKCSCCNGFCGPTNGCQCSSC